jgi:DNA gyrase subunit B
LEALINEFKDVEKNIKRLSRLYPDYLLKKIIEQDKLELDQMTDESAVKAWGNVLLETLNNDNKDAALRFDIDVDYDEETSSFMPVVVVVHHGAEQRILFSRDFFESKDYARMTELGSKLFSLLEEGAYVKKGERSEEITEFYQVIDWLMVQARRGLHIQRYKGLGEMNPSQLWETTMDPNVRRMLQVTIEDAVGADQLFTCLMGDHVEPRREFIESNALAVENLDF